MLLLLIAAGITMEGCKTHVADLDLSHLMTAQRGQIISTSSYRQKHFRMHSAYQREHWHRSL